MRAKGNLISGLWSHDRLRLINYNVSSGAAADFCWLLAHCSNRFFQTGQSLDRSNGGTSTVCIFYRLCRQPFRLVHFKNTRHTSVLSLFACGFHLSNTSKHRSDLSLQLLLMKCPKCLVKPMQLPRKKKPTRPLVPSPLLGEWVSRCLPGRGKQWWKLRPTTARNGDRSGCSSQASGI